MTSFLVTGGAGFIGSHLVRALLSKGHSVRVLDNFLTGKRENLAPVAADIDLHEGDLRSPEDCARACKGVEVILHQAARPSVPLSVESPRLSHDINITGTFNLLLAARDQGVRRVLFAASSSAYGESKVPVKHEGLMPSPLSPYAVTKLAGENYLRVFHTTYGLETLSLRYFNVFGPRQDPKSQYAAAIPAFVTALLHDQSPTIYGDGEQTRDFTHIENVIHANLLGSFADASSLQGQAINVACGEKVSVNDVIERINLALSKKISSNHVAERAGDIKHSLADISLAQKLIGYTPSVSFRDGLDQTIAWYRENTKL